MSEIKVIHDPTEKELKKVGIGGGQFGQRKNRKFPAIMMRDELYSGR